MTVVESEGHPGFSVSTSLKWRMQRQTGKEE
jgi:hypothetical protein